jgi:hypothetical protein
MICLATDAGRGLQPRHASELMDAQLLVYPSKTQCYIALYPVNINFILLLDEQNKLFDCQRYCIENMNIRISR